MKIRTNRLRFKKRLAKSLSAGFTLLELIVALAIISVLFAIATPGWSALLANWRLNAAQDVVYQALVETQSSAKRQHVTWQFSVQDSNGIVQWAIHPATVAPDLVFWQPLDQQVLMDAETTLQTTDGVRRVRFDQDGNIAGQLGRLTLRTKISDIKPKRCVIISTLLGAIRKGQDHRTQDNGKYCY